MTYSEFSNTFFFKFFDWWFDYNNIYYSIFTSLVLTLAILINQLIYRIKNGAWDDAGNTDLSNFAIGLLSIPFYIIVKLICYFVFPDFFY